jgi:integrase
MVVTHHSPPLTASAIKALEPRPDAYELADPGCPGLRLRVEPTGRRSFRWYTRDGDKRVVLTIGPWSERAEEGHVTLAEARQRLAALKAARDEGRLASWHRAPSAPNGAALVKDVARDFVAHLKRRRKTADQVERALDKDVLPVIGSIPIAAVTPRDVRQVVEAIVRRGAPSAADHVFEHLNGLLRFAVGRGELGTNPAATLDRDALGAETGRRARVLSDEEIAALWRALDHSGLTITSRTGLRLLVLLGVRSGELLRSRWEEVDLPGRVWTIPVDHQKLGRRQLANARPWRVPLSDQALAQFERLRVLSEGSAFVMASPQAEDGFTTDKALNHGMRRLFAGDPPLLSFPDPRPTPHDLRRTLRTGLARLKVPRDVAERSLNHALPEIESIYNTHDYFDERREALARWGAHVETLVSGTSNVVPLAAKGVRS